MNFETTLKLMNLWQLIQENACSTYQKDFQYKGSKKGYQLQLCQETVFLTKVCNIWAFPYQLKNVK